MKNIILSILGLCIGSIIACKHPIISESQPIVPQQPINSLSKRDTITFDYSIDTLKCDRENFRNMYDNGGIPRLTVPPNPTRPFLHNLHLNKSNEDELFVRTGDSLLKYNFVTKQTQVISVTATATELLDISNNNWHLFKEYGTNALLKMKANGDSIVPLADYCITAQWNNDGSKFIFSTAWNAFSIAEKVGTVIDRFGGAPASFFDWSKPDTIARQRPDGAIVIHNTITRAQGITIPSLGDPQGVCWLSDYKTLVVATGNSGLYIVNTETQQFRKIKCTAIYNSWYVNPQYSRKYKRIFAIKIQILSPYTFNQILVSMNIDGSDEKQIDIR
jgi:hypothetical protein